MLLCCLCLFCCFCCFFLPWMKREKKEKGSRGSEIWLTKEYACYNRATPAERVPQFHFPPPFGRKSGLHLAPTPKDPSRSSHSFTINFPKCPQSRPLTDSDPSNAPQRPPIASASGTTMLPSNLVLISLILGPLNLRNISWGI
jgi:hypothetical protein